MPIVFALGELMEYKNGRMSWRTDPFEFIRNNLAETLKVYYGMIQMGNYRPSKGWENGGLLLPGSKRLQVTGSPLKPVVDLTDRCAANSQISAPSKQSKRSLDGALP